MTDLSPISEHLTVRDALLAARSVIADQSEAVLTVAQLGIEMLESGRPALALLCLKWIVGEPTPEIDEADCDVRH